MIIGLTGTFASGKDTIADYLVEKKGFEMVGLGDIVREYVKKYSWPNTRESQQKMGNKLRDEHGADFLIKEAIKRTKAENIVIAGVRQPKEADFFKNSKSAYLISVDASVEERFDRITKRQRPGDPQSVQELHEKEEKEMNAGFKSVNCQNISYCMKMADYEIINDGNFEDLYKKIDDILKKISNS